MCVVTSILSSLVPFKIIMTFIFGPRITRKLELLQSLCCKVTGSSHNFCDDWLHKSCKYGRSGLFEHLLILFQMCCVLLPLNILCQCEMTLPLFQGHKGLENPPKKARENPSPLYMVTAISLASSQFEWSWSAFKVTKVVLSVHTLLASFCKAEPVEVLCYAFAKVTLTDNNVIKIWKRMWFDRASIHMYPCILVLVMCAK